MIVHDTVTLGFHHPVEVGVRLGDRAFIEIGLRAIAGCEMAQRTSPEHNATCVVDLGTAFFYRIFFR